MASYSPPNSTVEHLEFTNIRQTIAIADEELHQWKVQQVTGYSTSNGVRFDDLQFYVDDPVNGSKSWTYTSMFEYAVNRHLKYDIVSDDQTYLIYGEVNNIPELPEIYDNLYHSDPPAESMTVTMNIAGLQRTGSEQTTGGDPETGEGGTTTIVWGNWYQWNDTYTITITTNYTKHAELIQKACQEQRFVKNNVDGIQPTWIEF